MYLVDCVGLGLSDVVVVACEQTNKAVDAKLALLSALRSKLVLFDELRALVDRHVL